MPSLDDMSTAVEHRGEATAESASRRQGRAAVALARQRGWVLRRAEQLTFDDAITARRRSNLDIDVSALHRLNETSQLPRLGDRVLLPIMLVSRRAHFDLRILRDDGVDLPSVPRRLERDLVAAGLADLSLTLRTNDPDDDFVERPGDWADCRRRIREVIDGPPSPTIEGGTVVDGDLANIADYLHEYRQLHMVLAAPLASELFDDSQGARGPIRLVETHAESVKAILRRGFKLGALEELDVVAVRSSC